MPTLNTATTEAAVKNGQCGIIFQTEIGDFGVVWWDGPQYFIRMLSW